MTPNAEANPSPMKVLDGLLKRDALAADLGCHWRTVLRYERRGMPVIKVGNRVFYDPGSVRRWLLSHETGHETPTRGRPRKAARAPEQTAA